VVTGVILALLASILFGLNNAIVRRITQCSDTSIYHIVFYSLLVGSPLLITIGFIVEGLPRLVDISMLLGYAVIGIGHFIIGRSMVYYAISRIGGGPAATITSSITVLTAVFGVYLLGEPGSLKLWIGVFLIFMGATMASSTGMNFKLKDKLGLLIAFLATIIFSFTTIGIRTLNVAWKSPITGSAISYTSALLVFTIVSLLKGKNEVKSMINSRGKAYLVMAGLAVSLGQMFRYLALKFMYASIVTPVISSAMFFALIFVKLVPGTREHVGLPQILGAILTFTGIMVVTAS